MGGGASSLSPALRFQVTDIHALTLGIFSESEMNTSRLLLLAAPHLSSSAEFSSVFPRFFCKLVNVKPRECGNPRQELWAGKGHLTGIQLLQAAWLAVVCCPIGIP